MSTALLTAIRESCGYLQDEGWHQTARLMTVAAFEIECLNERVRELEAHLNTFEESADLQAPEASNQNGVRVAAVSSRR